MRGLNFFYDPLSPYAYFALKHVKTIAAKHQQLPIFCHPVLFAGLLNKHGQKGPAEIPDKRRYTFLDCMRIAAYDGLPFVGPPAHPFNPLLVQRMAAAIDDPQQRLRFASATIDACWGQGVDLTDQNILLKLAAHLNLDAEKIMTEAGSAAGKDRLRAITDSAIDVGVFGVPTVIVAECGDNSNKENGTADPLSPSAIAAIKKVEHHLFWGSDRMHLLNDLLSGGPVKTAVDLQSLERCLQRPRGADRKIMREQG